MKIKIEQLSAFFAQRHDESFHILDGSGVVMVSAPHSVEQTRGGKIKCAEPQTGVLARLLHDDLNCPVIYKTKNCNDDANFDEVSDYKDALVNYVNAHNIKFLIDLHQLSPYRKVNVNLGIAKFKNIDGIECLNVILGEFTHRDIGTVQIDSPYKAASPRTVSSFVRNACAIQCIQIELNSDLLYGEQSEPCFEKVFNALRGSVIKLNDLLGGTNEK